MTMNMNRVNILGVKVDTINMQLLLKGMTDCVRNDRRMIISNVNVYAINLAQKHQWFREFLNQAAINFCDGYGVILGAKILGKSIPERITYAEAMLDFARLCADNGFTLFLLGAKEGVAEKASQKLIERFPKLRIVGVHHGYFSKEKLGAENRSVVDLVNAASPDILIVGFGMPAQEQWLAENWDDLNARIAMTGGAVFDFISGEVPRAPRWMTDHGLEWLGRLLLEPRRMWRRYLLGNPIFLWRVLMQRLGVIKC